MLAFASKWGCLLGKWPTVNIKEVIQGCLNLRSIANLQGLEEEQTFVFLCTLMYCYWNYRNSHVFAKPERMENVVSKFNLLVEEWVGRQGVDAEQNSDQTLGGGPCDQEGWTTPPERWIKINTDASFKHGKAALGAIARDERGKLIFMAAKVVECDSARLAELFAINWASELAEEQKRFNICWSSDAAEIIKEINSLDDPAGWDSRFPLLCIKERSRSFNWKFFLE